MKTKLTLSLAVLAVAALAMGAASADSKRCANGTSIEGTGFSVANSGAPESGKGWAAVCNDNSVTAPGGHVEIGGNANTQEGYVYIDGEESNEELAGCADGYTRVELSAGGADFYNGPEGSVDDTNGSAPGSPDAQPETADEFLASAGDGC